MSGNFCEWPPYSFYFTVLFEYRLLTSLICACRWSHRTQAKHNRQQHQSRHGLRRVIFQNQRSPGYSHLKRHSTIAIEDSCKDLKRMKQILGKDHDSIPGNDKNNENHSQQQGKDIANKGKTLIVHPLWDIGWCVDQSKPVDVGFGVMSTDDCRKTFMLAIDGCKSYLLLFNLFSHASRRGLDCECLSAYSHTGTAFDNPNNDKFWKLGGTHFTNSGHPMDGLGLVESCLITIWHWKLLCDMKIINCRWSMGNGRWRCRQSHSSSRCF